ncbi:hypothetical protein BFW38_10035 [Terasakiispira papahanaumokuakeensis]|uniref:Uncharacterized protein n=1 Tax=Terasakiispira papahanaumokuakeensis TaxID=197479 RepID=A0A1E2VA16_9GAMM|nr:hypothetical protein [Terasakiispira papahanaumokuakeensis]ODC03831.1 hypothetical protein BFW38_10035 [Terasakiispira papahanaumokuakeensis]
MVKWLAFFSELECGLVAAVRYLGSGLDQDENKALLKTASACLNFGNEAGIGSSIAEDKEV